MKHDNETRENLLSSAKKEFMEKGYMQASLRNICKNAGVTTGALYFFFKDKEDLFAALVEEPLSKLYMVMNAHYQEEIELVNTGMTMVENFSEDLETAKLIIHYMYQYYDVFHLVLMKSQGSRYEQSVEKFVEITEKHYRLVADKMAVNANVKPVNDFVIHWIAHTQIDMFAHVLTHAESEEMAMKHMEITIKYLVSGWNGMFR
ncbi:TetR/AcrR family transcriptional regulator [Anaerosporobacter sp.]|uniref:TetR/AcrR family transcriptional regulator n=1 Tax=Anaerosporobacter sp. TaxID=1872529 RepID=UPI00286EF37D|nr:TetR/AcrR family transcriptional regulator [Anaerosporobacter sp.]